MRSAPFPAAVGLAATMIAAAAEPPGIAGRRALERTAFTDAEIAVPLTMLNDDVRLEFFGIYNQHILDILYDPRIRPGMSAGEVRALLPQVLPQARRFVARTNDPAP